MRACARVKWRFRRSAVVVSLRDGSEFGDSVVFCSRASLRDSTSITLRLPRPQGGLAMTRNWNGFVWKTDAFCCMRSFCAVSCRIVFQTFRFENCPVFPKNLPILSLRGGHFQCLTRQSLTERTGIPERGTARLRSEIRSLIV